MTPELYFALGIPFGLTALTIGTRRATEESTNPNQLAINLGFYAIPLAVATWLLWPLALASGAVWAAAHLIWRHAK